MNPVTQELATDLRPSPVATTILVGNPRRASRTLDVACRVAAQLRHDLDAAGLPLTDPGLVDLSLLGPALGDWGTTRPEVGAASRSVCRSRLLLVASPTFKASYAGLLKVFFDQLPRRALAGVVAVPVMTAASVAHAFAVDHCLRPVLVELGAAVPVPGLTVLEAEFDSAEPLRRWSAASTPVLSAVLAG